MTQADRGDSRHRQTGDGRHRQTQVTADTGRQRTQADTGDSRHRQTEVTAAGRQR